MGAHTEYRQVDIVTPVNRAARAVAVVIVLAAVLAAVAAIAYGYGHATRRSDASVARERAAAVQAAVARAVAAKGAADHLIRLKIVDRHVAAQRSADLELMQRVLLSEQRAGDRRAAAAFSRGQSTGRALVRAARAAAGAAGAARAGGAPGAPAAGGGVPRPVRPTPGR